jgi:hypothetical protein
MMNVLFNSWFSLGRPLWLFALGVERPKYTSACTHTIVKFQPIILLTVQYVVLCGYHSVCIVPLFSFEILNLLSRNLISAWCNWRQSQSRAFKLPTKDNKDMVHTNIRNGKDYNSGTAACPRTFSTGLRSIRKSWLLFSYYCSRKEI